MSSTPAVRQMVVEQPLGQARDNTLWAEGKPLVRWWPRLHGCARGILLAPQFPGQGDTVVWSWSESSRGAEVDSGALVAVRRRLRESAINLREEESDQSPPLAVVEAFGRWMDELAARNDGDLSRFVCVTLHGPMVHSWGARSAAVPRVEDAVDFDVAGTVMVMGKADAGHQVVLEDARGSVVGKMRSDTSGRFRFSRIVPGRYRLRGVSERVDFPVTGLTIEVTTASVETLELKSSASVAGRGSPAASPVMEVPAAGEAEVVSPSPPVPVAPNRKRGTALVVWMVAGGLALAVVLLWRGGWLTGGTRPPEVVSGSVNAPPDEVGGARAPGATPASVAGDFDPRLPNGRRPTAEVRAKGFERTGPGLPGGAKDREVDGRKDPQPDPEHPAGSAAVSPEGASFQSRQSSLALPQSSLPGSAAGHAPGSGSSLAGGPPTAPGSPGGPPGAGAGRPNGPAGDAVPAGLTAGSAAPGAVAARPNTGVGKSGVGAEAPPPAPAPPGAYATALSANPLAPEKPKELNQPLPSGPPPNPEVQADLQPVTDAPASAPAHLAGDTPSASDASADGVRGREGAAVADRSRSERLRPQDERVQAPRSDLAGPEGAPRSPEVVVATPAPRLVRILISPGRVQPVRDQIVETFPQPIGNPGGKATRGRESRVDDQVSRTADFAELVVWFGIAVKSPRSGGWVEESGASDPSFHVRGNELGWRGTAPPGARATWSSRQGAEVVLQRGRAGEWEVSYPADTELSLWWATPRATRSARNGDSPGNRTGTPVGAVEVAPAAVGASLRYRWLRLENPSEPCLLMALRSDEGTTWQRASVPIGSISSRGERMALVDDVTGWAWVTPVQVTP